MTRGALDGLRVVELSARNGGAFCAKLFADLGATVVKVEPVGGDARRHCDPMGFLYRNTGKQSACLANDDEFGALVAGADVLVDDADHPLLAAIDLSELAELVWCSIRPFGLTGPYADAAATHLTTFHAGGEGHLLPSGLGWALFPDRPPIQIGAGAGDHDSGANAAVAILAALRQRGLTRRGQRIDISDHESQLTLNRSRLSRFTNDGVVMRRMGSPYPLGGMTRCADGWVQAVGIRDEHWVRLGANPDGACFVAPPFDTPEARMAKWAELAQLLRTWASTRPKDHVAALLADAGCAVGAYAEPTELPLSAQLRHREFFQEVVSPTGETVALPGAPYRLSRTPVVLRPAPVVGQFGGFTGERWLSPTETSTSGATPLHGVRVLDFTWAAAGPYATVLLSLLGAEVIKVESSRRPDMARRGFLADYGGAEKSPNFNELNLGKRSITVDLTNPLGLELINGLVAHCDVVVDNFRPGVLDRLGLGAKRLLAQHSRLVVACSSANGSTGPDAAGAGLASIFGATGSLSAQTGYEDGPPTEIGESTDYRSANFLALAILAALAHRDRTGEGQLVDVSSREVVIMLAAEGYLASLAADGGSVPLRRGNRDRVLAPHNVYRAAGEDEWIALAVVNDDSWAPLCALIGHPEWASRYVSAAARKLDEDAIDEAISVWTAERSAAASFEELRAIGVAASPCFTNEQLAGDEHLHARDVLVEVTHPVIGRQRVMRAPWLMSGAPCPIDTPGPLLGQHSADVLKSLLGLNEEDLAKYAEALQ